MKNELKRRSFLKRAIGAVGLGLFSDFGGHLLVKGEPPGIVFDDSPTVFEKSPKLFLCSGFYSEALGQMCDGTSKHVTEADRRAATQR